MQNNTDKVVFKDYNPKQIMLLPPSLEELIDPHHPVRVVNQVVDQINISTLLDQYRPGGTSVYHPRMLLKVLIYGYLTNTFSSRKIEAALQENIHFMWLSGMNKPDHNTIARFRTERLKDTLKALFTQIVELLVEEGLVSIKNIYTDGTKIEAQANKYSFVWGKAIRTNKQRIAQQLKELWQYTQKLTEQELAEEISIEFKEINADKVSSTIEKIDQALAGKPISKKIKQKINYGRKNWPGKLKEYEEKEAILGKRNSFSKTDPDATFMRMKEDHMLNGQLKAAYNWQISTSNQYIVHYSLHQNPTDTLTLKPHLSEFERRYQTNPESICADSGYGSEENYEYLQQKKIDNYIKYNYFDKEQRNPGKKNPFRADHLYYNEQQDIVYCPMGQPMHRIGEQKRHTSNGFEQLKSQYQAKNCSGCPLRSSCFKGKGNRIVEINHRLRRYKQKARKNLLSEEGVKHRRQRLDVETVFAAIKHNKGFRRFWLRGLEKVEIEAGLLAIAHNMAKKAA